MPKLTGSTKPNQGDWATIRLGDDLAANQRSVESLAVNVEELAEEVSNLALIIEEVRDALKAGLLIKTKD